MLIIILFNTWCVMTRKYYAYSNKASSLNTPAMEKGNVWNVFTHVNEDKLAMFSVRVVESWAISEVKFPSPEDIDGTIWADLEDSVHLPTQALLGSASNGVVKMVFAAYNEVEDFLGTVSSSRRGVVHNASHIINSRVIAASTSRYPVVKLAEPVTVTFRLVQEENVTNPQCVYWDLDTRLWSIEGCWLRKANRTHAVCACDHLTNFALLMEVKVVEPTTRDMLLLRIIVLVGCAVSMILLVLTALLLQIFRNFPNDHSTIHKHLCICLLLTEAVFVAGADLYTQPVVCAFLAGALHLVLQSVFVWLFLAAFQLYVLLLGPAHSSRSRVRCYCLVAYGMSALIVSVSAIIDPKSYGTSSYCFLRFDNYYIFSFVGPAVTCVLGAVMFLGLTLCRTCWVSTKSSSAKHKELFNANTAKVRSREAWLVLLSSTGTWTFLLLYWDQRTPALAYLFTALNCLQSLAAFICFGLRNEEVRQAYRKWQERCSGSSCGQPQAQQHPKTENHHPAGQFVLPATSSQHSLPHRNWNSTTDPQLQDTTSTIQICATPGHQSTAIRKSWSPEDIDVEGDSGWCPTWKEEWQQSKERDLAFLDLLASSRPQAESRNSAEHIYECIDDIVRDPRSWNSRKRHGLTGRPLSRCCQQLTPPCSPTSLKLCHADNTHPDVVRNGLSDIDWTAPRVDSETFEGDGTARSTPSPQEWFDDFPSTLRPPVFLLPSRGNEDETMVNNVHSTSR